MLIESLVAFSCLTNNGCTESINSYYSHYPEIQEAMADQERYIRNKLHPNVTDYLIPAIGILAKGSYHTSINGVGIGFNINNIEQNYSVTFKIPF